MELAIALSVDSENPVENDLRLLRGDFVWSTDLADEVAMRLRIRFKFFRGEWFLDQREGVPYYDRILIKNPDMDAIRAIFRRVILDTPGVVSLDSLSIDLDRTTRAMSAEFSARLDDGSVFFSPEFGAFIVGF